MAKKGDKDLERGGTEGQEAELAGGTVKQGGISGGINREESATPRVGTGIGGPGIGSPGTGGPPPGAGQKQGTGPRRKGPGEERVDRMGGPGNRQQGEPRDLEGAGGQRGGLGGMGKEPNLEGKEPDAMKGQPPKHDVD